MSDKVFITVTGISSKHGAKQSVRKGDTLHLVKDPSNTYDSDAIAVYLGFEQVGYVGNSPKTVRNNCKSATQIQAFFSSNAKALVTDVTTVEFASKDGGIRKSKAFICQLIIEKERESVQTMAKSFTFKLIGSFNENPGKMKLADIIKKGEEATIKLVKEGAKIVGYLGSEKCGHIEPRAIDGLSPYDEVDALMTKERVAKIQKAVATNYIGVITVDEAEAVSEVDSMSLKGIIEKAISSGLITQAEVDERLAYAKKYGVTDKQLRSVFGTMKFYPEEVAKRIPVRPKTLYVDTSGIVKRCVAYVNKRRNLGFEGDRGVGKNVLTETLAWLYKRPLWESSLNSGADNHSLLGGQTFEDTADEPKEETIGFFKNLAKLFKKGFGFKHWFSAEAKEDDALFIMSIFKKIVSYFTGKNIKYKPEIGVLAAMYGGFLVMDEFNTLYGHILSMFNSLLDDRRRIHVPGFKTIEADETFIVISTQNKDYNSTFDTNEATVDRFVPIVFPPLNSIIDVLTSKFPSLQYDVLNKCEFLYKSIKKCVEDREIDSKAISIRGFIDACLVIDEDIDLKDALIDNIANRAQETDDIKAIKDMIDDMF